MASFDQELIDKVSDPNWFDNTISDLTELRDRSILMLTRPAPDVVPETISFLLETISELEALIGEMVVYRAKRLN